MNTAFDRFLLVILFGVGLMGILFGVAIGADALTYALPVLGWPTALFSISISELSLVLAVCCFGFVACYWKQV